MHFTINPDTLSAISSDGHYTVQRRGDRYGTFLDISYDGKPSHTVWVRENHRAVLPHETAPAGDADAVVEWVVDNQAQTGADQLVTLADPIGAITLGELLQWFFKQMKLHAREPCARWTDHGRGDLYGSAAEETNAR